MYIEYHYPDSAHCTHIRRLLMQQTVRAATFRIHERNMYRHNGSWLRYLECRPPPWIGKPEKDALVVTTGLIRNRSDAHDPTVIWVNALGDYVIVTYDTVVYNGHVDRLIDMIDFLDLESLPDYTVHTVCWVNRYNFIDPAETFHCQDIMADVYDPYIARDIVLELHLVNILFKDFLQTLHQLDRDLGKYCIRASRIDRQWRFNDTDWLQIQWSSTRPSYEEADDTFTIIWHGTLSGYRKWLRRYKLTPLLRAAVQRIELIRHFASC